MADVYLVNSYVDNSDFPVLLIGIYSNITLAEEAKEKEDSFQNRFSPNKVICYILEVTLDDGIAGKTVDEMKEHGEYFHLIAPDGPIRIGKRK